MQLELERDGIFAKFEGSIYDVQQKCGLQSLLLQKKVQLLEEKLEKKVTHLNTNPFMLEINALWLWLINFEYKRML